MWIDSVINNISAFSEIKPYQEDKLVFTKKNNAVYAIYLADESEWQMPATIRINSFPKTPLTKIYLLGYDKPLAMDKNNSVITVAIPEKIRKTPPAMYAWVFKITGL